MAWPNMLFKNIRFSLYFRLIFVLHQTAVVTNIKNIFITAVQIYLLLLQLHETAVV